MDNGFRLASFHHLQGHNAQNKGRLFGILGGMAPSNPPMSIKVEDGGCSGCVVRRVMFSRQ